MLRKTVKNIFAVRNDRFGEFLLTIPALTALKDAYPGSRLTLAVNPYVRELAHCITGVDEVLCWEHRRHSLGDIVRMSALLRARQFDLCVVFNACREANLAVFLAGIPLRVGYDHKWPFLLTHKVRDEKCREARHEVAYNLELIRPLGIEAPQRIPSLSIGPACAEGLAKGWDKDLPTIAVHPFTSDPIKQWPLGNFFSLVKELAGRLRARIIIIGGKEELQHSHLFSDAAGPCVINLIGKTSLVQLAGVLSKCSLLVSGDSGPVHLASCVGLPAVVLFRNDLPGKGPTRWGPLSPGSAVIEKSTVISISVREVLEKILSVWGK